MVEDAAPENPSRLYPVHFFTHGRLFGVDPPAVLFLWGSDSLGRDIFSRVLYGGQVSLLTGMAAAAVALGLGLLLGVIAGYFGSWPDHVLMRTGELAMSVPRFYLLLAARAFLPLHIGPLDAFLLLVGIIGALGWCALPVSYAASPSAAASNPSCWPHAASAPATSI
jgi:peptide/nickel transport system permease protein